MHQTIKARDPLIELAEIELAEIERVLSSHAAVAACAVIARRDSGDGDADARSDAYVIPRGIPVAGYSLRDFLVRNLPARLVPASVTLLEALPLDADGGLDRDALPRPAGEPPRREPLKPRNALERQLTGIWERELDIAPIGVADELFDLGVPSILAARLFAAIEHELERRLPLGAIFRAPSIRSLAELLEADEGKPRWTSLVPIQPGGLRTPIFCVHGGGGTILHLAPLARRLGADQPLYGLQSRGLYGGVVPPATVQEMASLYISEMREVHRVGPWRLAGYCFGALVAFEIAQQLRAEGEQVELLAMFNGPSPAWIERWGWYGNQPSKRVRASTPASAPAGAVSKRRRTGSLVRVRRALREPRRFRTALVWHSWRVGGERLARVALVLGRPLPEQVREEYFLHLHARAERAYAPRPYDGDLLVFHGEHLYEDPTLGWAGLTTGKIHTLAVPGDHVNNRQALVEPYVAIVSELLQAHLADGPAASGHHGCAAKNAHTADAA